MIITFIASDRPEDRIRVQLRLRNNMDAINRTGIHLAYLLDLVAFIQNTPQAQKICNRSDILVIYRYLYGPVLKTIQYWKARDKKVIVDIDQALDCLTPGMPDYSLWVEGKPGLAAFGNRAPESGSGPLPLEQFRWGLGMVDAATVVSARLARDWSRYTSVYEIPDYLNPSHYPGLEQEGQEEVWIGLSPAASHATLLQSGLAAALELVCRQYPQVRVILPDIEKKALKDLDVDPARLITCSSPFFDEWVDLLLRLDLGLAPFASDFDLRLGPVHLLEFMIAKVPWIATQRPAFPELSGYGMWVQNAPQAWAVALAKAVDGLAFYQKKAGGESFLYALGQEAGAHIDKALQIYSAIASR